MNLPGDGLWLGAKADAVRSGLPSHIHPHFFSLQSLIGIPDPRANGLFRSIFPCARDDLGINTAMPPLTNSCFSNYLGGARAWFNDNPSHLLPVGCQSFYFIGMRHMQSIGTGKPASGNGLRNRENPCSGYVSFHCYGQQPPNEYSAKLYKKSLTGLHHLGYPRPIDTNCC